MRNTTPHPCSIASSTHAHTHLIFLDFFLVSDAATNSRRRADRVAEHPHTRIDPSAPAVTNCCPHGNFFARPGITVCFHKPLPPATIMSINRFPKFRPHFLLTPLELDQLLLRFSQPPDQFDLFVSGRCASARQHVGRDSNAGTVVAPRHSSRLVCTVPPPTIH